VPGDELAKLAARAVQPRPYRADGATNNSRNFLIAALLDVGEYDDLPESAFYMVGTIEEAVEKGRKLAAEARHVLEREASDLVVKLEWPWSRDLWSEPLAAAAQAEVLGLA